MTGVIVGGRRSGKTERILEWVEAGSPRAEYPFWTRTVLCATEREAARLRELLWQRAAGVPHPSHLSPEDQQQYPDIYRWVFSAEDWRGRRQGIHPSELALDNADLILGQLFGRLDVVSMTGYEL